MASSDDYPNDTSTTANLIVGAQFHGTIDSAGDKDWIKLSLQAGTNYIFDFLGKNGGGGTLQTPGLFSIYGSNSPYNLDSSTGGGIGGSPRLQFTPQSSGTYFLETSGSSPGSYTVQATTADTIRDDYGNTPAGAGTLAIGGQASGNIERNADADWFNVTLQAGTSYVFDLLGGHSGGGTLGAGTSIGILSEQLTLFDANSKFLSLAYSGGDSGEPRLTFVPTTSGSYYLQVNVLNSTLGSYTLKAATKGAATDDYGNSATTAGTLVLNGQNAVQINGAIERVNDLDWFKVSLHGGTKYAFTQIAGSLSGGVLSLVDSQGKVLGQTYGGGSISYKASGDIVLFLQESYVPASSTSAQSGTYSIKAQEMATYGDDVLSGGPGNDTINGGLGSDTARYNGTRDHFTITKTDKGFSVIDNTGAEGNDTLIEMERIQFADKMVALTTDGSAGQAYRLYQAAFNRAPDSAGLGYWISTLEKGATLTAVASGFTHSAEFANLFGANPSHEVLLNGFYHNVLHRDPDQGGKEFWLKVLDSGVDGAAVLASFSESPENQAALATIIGNGISYTPYG